MVIRDKKFIKYLDQEDIQKVVRKLGRRINKDYKSLDPLIISILNGSFVFAADLTRELKQNFRIFLVFYRFHKRVLLYKS